VITDDVSLVACEGVAVDVFTGRVTAFNLIETIFAQAFPARLGRLHLLARYHRAADEPAAHFFERFEPVGPDNIDVLNALPLEVTVGARFHTSIHNAWTLVLTARGDYQLRLLVADSAEGPWRVARQHVVVADLAPHPLMPTRAAPEKTG
jgi:hypothetical protein